MAQNRGFIHGAMLLAGAAVVSKLLGSIYTIVLQNIIGDHGMGLFQMAYPIYATLLAVATAGFPVAISKLVSERLAMDDPWAAKRVFQVAMSLLSVLGVFTFCLLFFGAQTWARVAGDTAAAPAIRAIAPALLIVPVMSAVRGYFQGYQWMEPTASSQVLEQFVRVATILGLAIWLVDAGYSREWAAAGAAFGAVTGAAAGLIMLGYFWVKRPFQGNRQTSMKLTNRQIVKQLLYYAFPISLGALVVPLMNNVDVVTVVNLLKASGVSQQAATTDFGLLSGRAFKLMMLPTTLAAGIGIAVMPAVSEAFTLGFRRLVSSRIDLAIRLTIMLALPAAAGLALLARPIDIALFTDGRGTTTIQIMALATVFASAQTTAAAILQGAGWVYLPVVNLSIAGIVKLGANLLLVPMFGIRGAAAATVVSYVTATILNFYALTRGLKEPMQWKNWILKPVTATFIMSAVTFGAFRQWSLWVGETAGRIQSAAALLILVTMGILVYGIALLAAGAMSEDELAAVPKVGPSLVSLFSRLGLLR